MGKGKKAYRYNGSFEKVFFTGKEVAKMFDLNYKKLRMVLRLLGFEKREGYMYEIYPKDLKKVKEAYYKLKV